MNFEDLDHRLIRTVELEDAMYPIADNEFHYLKWKDDSPDPTPSTLSPNTFRPIKAVRTSKKLQSSKLIRPLPTQYSVEEPMDEDELSELYTLLDHFTEFPLFSEVEVLYEIGKYRRRVQSLIMEEQRAARSPDTIGMREDFTLFD